MFFGFFSFVLRFITSSKTKICPSQNLDAPIPMVGIDMLFVIIFAAF